MARQRKLAAEPVPRRRRMSLAQQFRTAADNQSDPALWPPVPRALLLLAVAAFVLALLWFFVLKNVNAQWQQAQEEEVQLRQQFQTKLQKAVSLEGLKLQREQVLQFVNLLEKQLPGRAEMDALLSDINQAGLGRSLQFDLFKPGSVTVKDYYAELPIAIRVTGSYHDMGAFAADIASMPRIVTLGDLAITPAADKDKGALVLNATAKTYRYLDADEVAEQEQARKGSKG